jgi:regulator of sigma E protease
MWITVAQFILSLSILIVLHELGHFSTAKWFKTRVEKFYLFFNPYFSLFKVQVGETEYGLGWLPLGGYVKISGMIDESFDSEQMSGPPQPWEFRAKPAWQRLIIMIGGVTVNFILGILLFGVVFFVWGERYLPSSELKEGIVVTEQGYELGLRDGDKIIKVGDLDASKFSPSLVNKGLIIDGAKTIEVERSGTVKTIPVDPKWAPLLSKYENKNMRLVGLKMPAQVSNISKNSLAKAGAAGVQKDDVIIGVNDKKVDYMDQFVSEVIGLPKDGTPETTFTILRGQDTLSLSYTTLFDKKKTIGQRLFNRDADKQRRLGFELYDSEKFFNYKSEKFDMGPALAKGWSESWGFLGDQINAFGQMFKGNIKAKDSLGSFISIGKLFGPEWEWKRFWRMTAMLSILLGFFNLLPIPALDGGYVMFLLFESITGIKVPDSVMEKATMIGFFILIAFMIYALGLDIVRHM